MGVIQRTLFRYVFAIVRPPGSDLVSGNARGPVEKG